jgi:hypothetical protein
VQRNHATQLKEHEPLFNCYEHLSGVPRGDAALTLLRKVASTVKPIMRKRGWRVQILAEFLPPEGNLLGLNINRGYKICIRLRYHNNTDLFLPLEQIVDTMLHELSHNKWGEHDSKFHALWDELRDEYETLVRKGYTGEGFMSAGRRLGGGRPPTERDLRELARAGAEKRRTMSTLSAGSGRRLGGSDIMLGQDAREVIAGQALLRNTINKGCGSTRSDAGSLAQSSLTPSFKTKAEEDDANDRAITQALYELMEEEETAKLNGTFATPPGIGGLAWNRDQGLYDPSTETRRPPTEEEQMKWAMEESARTSRASPNSMASGALTPESLVLPIKPLFAPSKSSHSTTTHSPPSVPPPSSIVSPISPLFNSSSCPTYSAKPQPPTKSPSPVSPIYHDSAPPKRKASTTMQHISSSARKNDPAPTSPIAGIDISEPFNPDQWACTVCTCINPTRYLACDACGVERPQGQSVRRRRTIKSAGSEGSSTTKYGSNGLPVGGEREREKEKERVRERERERERQSRSVGWGCARCGAYMEHKWWTCSACGAMKESS